jgi:hypothetical protein
MMGEQARTELLFCYFFVPGGIMFRRTTPVQQTLFTKIRALFKRTDRKSNMD